MKLNLILGLLLVAILVPVFSVFAESEQIADHIVINELDVNPLGDDSKSVIEWVELYNPTNQTVDLGGWTIGATSGLKTIYKISDGVKIKSGGFLTYTYGPLWLPDVSAIVQLKNKNATVIDQTKSLIDTENNYKSWQRLADGFDTDSDSDWVLKTSNAGSSNGKITSTEIENILTVYASTDKESYVFGDTIVITGSVSKKITVQNQLYTPEKINLIISGPSGFEKRIVLYPNSDLMFKTTIKADKTLNFHEGDYNISVQYGGAKTGIKFFLGETSVIEEPKDESSILAMSTDMVTYIPGNTVTLTANTTKIVPYAGLQFKVFDPNNKQVYDGTLYPDTKGRFSVQFLINSVNPVFGTFQVVATYDKENIKTSYELVPEFKEDSIISLNTDKKAYGLGDTVIITGRSNKVWVPTLDIRIVQSYSSKAITDTYVVEDIVRLEGDGTFKYSIKIPSVDTRYGDYKIKVSTEMGSQVTSFKVVENPSEFIEVASGPLSIWTDKESYNVGDSMTILGSVTEKKDLGRVTVLITLTKPDGTPIISKGDQRASAGKNQDSIYSFTGIPDATGNFQVKTGLYRNAFEKGNYLIKAVYGTHIAKKSFVIEDPLDLGAGVQILAHVDKQVYGIGEEVKLEGKVSTFTAQTAYEIILTDPVGKTTRDGTTIDNGYFTWSWVIPPSAKMGSYKISVHSDSDDTSVSFLVSNDTESEIHNEPLFITTDKAVYVGGDEIFVTGHAIKRDSGSEGLVVHSRPEITLKSESNKVIYKAFADLNAGGDFKTSFKIVPAIFKTGDYKISAKYYDVTAQTVFKVVDKFGIGADVPLVLLVDTDKEQYLPGDVALITGKTSKIVSVYDVELTISKEGKNALPVKIPFDSTGSFNYEFKIPETDSLGKYIVRADTSFDTVKDSFEVVTELPKEQTQNETTTEPTPIPKKIVDKVNRFTGSSTQITLAEKMVDDKLFIPRVLDGSLRVNAGEESNVHLKLSLEDGTCIIGPDSQCKITKSTRNENSLYEIIEIGGVNYKVRYSGTDAKLEKFTILSEEPQGSISIGNLDVEIIKENQISRFYYKISYTSSE